MINIRNISKRYEDKVILDNANLVILENRISVLIGKSGEGKSTLFRMIMKLETIDSGEIIVNENKKLGMVFQNFELYPHLSVLNNLIVPQKVICKISREKASKRALEVLHELNIEYLTDKTISTLSGGEAQRLAIARALVMDNNVLLLDEPTSALDHENVNNLVELLQRLSQKMTLFVITHDFDFARKIADKSYKIVKSKIVEYSIN